MRRPAVRSVEAQKRSLLTSAGTPGMQAQRTWTDKQLEALKPAALELDNRVARGAAYCPRVDLKNN